MRHDHLISFSDLPEGFEKNAKLTAEKRDFAVRVQNAMAMTEKEVGVDGRPVFRLKAEKLQELDIIVSHGTDKLDSSQIMSLFSAYRDLAAFDKMIDLYKRVDNEDFKNAPMVREQLAVAYRKVPRGEKLADKMWDYHRSMDLCFELIDEGRGNGVTYSNIGRCLRYIAEKTEMADKKQERERKEGLLSDSVRRLEEGFLTTLESSVGMQAVHGNIMLGNTDRARETAKVVYLAALRDGAEESSDYFCVSTALQAVRDYSYSYRGCGSVFRGANRVGGNVAFGGQLPDHSVSRKDLRLFTGLVKMTPAQLGIKFDKPVAGYNAADLMNTPLTDINDPEVFMSVADQFIRQTFTTENFAGSGLHMEDNALSKNEYGESRYDATVKSVLRACGKKIGERDADIDTRTNISAIFALGMGDCRHHAQVKQIMFDMWQKEQMNSYLSDMYYQAWQGKPVDENCWQAKEFYNALDTELRTADVEVRVPVKMEQETRMENGVPKKVDIPYKPLMRDGKFIPDDPTHKRNLEEHTLCWLIRKNRDGKLTEFGLRDAFYQDKHYAWGRMDIKVKDIHVTLSGKPSIPAGKIDGSKTTTGQAVSVVQVPTVYNSGKRDSFIKDSIGRDVCLVGIPLSGFKDSDAFLKMIKDREGMAKIMRDVLVKDPETKGWKKELSAANDKPASKPAAANNAVRARQAAAGRGR